MLDLVAVIFMGALLVLCLWWLFAVLRP